MESSLRDGFFFLQQANSGEERLSMMGTGYGRRGMGHDADGARGGLGLVGMVMSGFDCRRPQHQGQAEPRRPSRPKRHLLSL